MSESTTTTLNGKRDRRAHVAVLDKALNIIEILIDEPDLGLTDISDRSGAGKTACYRILNTLEARQYVAKNQTTRKYRPGNGLIGLSARLVTQLDLVTVCRPYLQALQRETGETVNLGVFVDDTILYLDIIESEQSVRNAGSVGARSDLHSSALGKAVLAAMDPQEAAAVVDRITLDPKTPRTVTSKADLLKELDQIRLRGYAIDDEEDQIGGRCVGAAVFGIDGSPIAAVSVSGLVATIPTNLVDVLGTRLTGLAVDLSDALSGHSDPN